MTVAIVVGGLILAGMKASRGFFANGLLGGLDE